MLEEDPEGMRRRTEGEEKRKERAQLEVRGSKRSDKVATHLPVLPQTLNEALIHQPNPVSRRTDDLGGTELESDEEGIGRVSVEDFEAVRRVLEEGQPSSRRPEVGMQENIRG